MPARNLFSPAFGGLPQVFFGRKNELAFTQAALDNDNSPHRAFFITGNRGCGKTTLLERISQLASKRGWVAIDVHSAHATQAILEALAGGTQKTVGKSAKPSALGVSLGEVSSSTTTAFSQASLGRRLVDKCRSLNGRKGILITVDEVQKVPAQDAEDLCASVQLARRKGLPIMLVLAGLPGSKETVASYPGCTFMQRSYDMRIGCMRVDETIDALKRVFGKTPEYQISNEAIWEMGLCSQGYPYLMQLLGYYVVERAMERMTAGKASIDKAHVCEIEPLALEAYRENVLVPILGALPKRLSEYLRAMCEVEDGQGVIQTGEVADRLGKMPPQVSSYRKRLIDRRLIEAGERGRVFFLLPHIREYYQGQTAALEQRDPRQQWNRYR